MQNKIKIQWAGTPHALAVYTQRRAEAQARANKTGFDHGLEANELFKDYIVFVLPRRENRYGHELRCEVVSCENMTTCQPGHGPRR